jgi:hypothetical protein
MRSSRMRVLAAALGAALLSLAPAPTFAQNSGDQKPPDKPPAAAGDGKEAPKKVDEFAEAEKTLGGPAANPECLVVGRKVVALLFRDDVDTALRQLDFYDRFGCPATHIQAAFRCVVRLGALDPKAEEKIANRVHACWINPGTEAQQGTAAVPSSTTNR